MGFELRRAHMGDVAQLADLIDRSVRELQRFHYSERQIEAALHRVFGVDSQLITDDTYFVVTPESDSNLIVGCGGWSRRRTLFGGDQWLGREESFLDPDCDAAKIRAFFVHPEWTRQGIATLILDHCESAIREAGFTRAELGATLTGVPLYAARGYIERERSEAQLDDGITLSIIRLEKTL
jgi:GNAT superfamily N-acetyltransferase